MSLTIKEVNHIADLARLNLTEEEKRKYQEQLSAILDYAARLQQLDTNGIAPTSSVLSSASPLRPDQAGISLPVEETLRNSADKKDNQFRVPPVFE
jgi:aspartyl-tRNA(Asn)/glutamyl-tRNA(Gln) amidotransferase subunit C